MVELALGALLLVVTFTGSFIVGLRASAPIEQIRRRQAEFTADASHELRTPLSVIQAEVDLALEPRPGSRPATGPPWSASRRRASACGRSSTTSCGWPGTTATPRRRLRRRHRRPRRGPALRRSGSRPSPLAGRRRALVHPAEPGPVAPVVADPDAIDRLVSVLVDNACRYAGTEGRSSSQVVQVRGPGDPLRSTTPVPGIPADQQELVLDRFHRADDRPGGTGLGLAIADAVVRPSGGAWSIGRSARRGPHGGDVASGPRPARTGADRAASAEPSTGGRPGRLRRPPLTESTTEARAASPIRALPSDLLSDRVMPGFRMSRPYHRPHESTPRTSAGPPAADPDAHRSARRAGMPPFVRVRVDHQGRHHRLGGRRGRSGRLLQPGPPGHTRPPPGRLRPARAPRYGGSPPPSGAPVQRSGAYRVGHVTRRSAVASGRPDLLRAAGGRPGLRAPSRPGSRAGHQRLQLSDATTSSRPAPEGPSTAPPDGPPASTSS